MKVEEILLAAVEKKTPAERTAYLDGACENNAELRAQVVALLKSHEQAGSFLARPLRLMAHCRTRWPCRNSKVVLLVPKVISEKERRFRLWVTAPDLERHRKQAEAAKRGKNWFAAAFHWIQLAAHVP